MKLEKLLLVSALALTCAVAGARENYHEKSFNADTKEKFQTVAANIRKEMNDGGRYEYVTPKEHATIEQKLGEIETLFTQYDSIANMKQDQKVQLFNAQDTVNSILTHRDRDRVICKNEAPLGSHIPVTSCHTYGQEEDARHETHNQLDEWKRLGCVKAGCGPAGKPPANSSGDSR
jgi:hypothetical protein